LNPARVIVSLFKSRIKEANVRNLFHWHASDARNDEPRPSVITCKKCGGVCQRVASLPKRFENAAYEVFQCLTCEFVDWVQRD